MKVRATAIATERSRAIGTVELECAPHGLLVTYLGVGAFSTGYAPGALTHGTRVTVPWDAVVEARAEGPELFLAVEPRLTPHHRLVLSAFTSGDAIDPRELFRQRLVLRVAGVGAALLGMVLVALTVPRVSPETGGAGAVLIGFFTALALLCVALVLDARLGRGADGDSAREALVGELGLYLPSLVRAPTAPRRPAPPLTIPVIQGLLPRTTFAISVTLAAGVLATLLTTQWVVSGGAAERYPDQFAQTDAQPRVPGDALQAATPPAGPAPPRAAPPAPRPTVASPAEAPAATGQPCRCGRADSALWAEPIPRLSTLLLEQRVVHRGNKNRLEVSVAAVNNGNRDLTDVALRLNFIERDPPPSNKTYVVANRAVFFEGPLAPGQAIKWTVEARGTAFELEHDYRETLDADGADAAPTNLLAELLQANHRPVRLHGAMMLAYLGDPRARAAVLQLEEAQREDEVPYLRRLLQATADLRSCRVAVDGVGVTRRVQACVFNAGKEPARNVGLRVRALEFPVTHLLPTATPPGVLGDAKWQVAPLLAPSAGVTFKHELALPPEAAQAQVFETYADRFDLLD